MEFNKNRLTPYIFRHTYTALLYYSGVRLKDAQYYMGHSDSKMLNEVYIHLDKHKLRENNVIENFVEEKIKSTTKSIELKLLSDE
ncbi:tyrosine-type recombinase/integrase [Thomasclavelia cocleata]|uniref:tyrosine-type recombinase/integrase n=1 Tax=Thomasclavelia cocleata TaxID=69824 RepID=UPI0034E39391